ncbi:MAG: helix-turn-helix domain-containing protein [Pseudonocardia sp.]
MSGRPVTDETREQVRQLHAQGLSRNEIARQFGRSGRTISLIAKDLGLTFDRAAETEVATRVRQADNKARRAGIIASLYDIAEDDIAHLRKQGGYDLVEASAGKAVAYRVERLPAQDRKALVPAISTGTNAAVRLEQVDADTGAGEVGSLLTTLFDRLRDRHGDG